VKTSLLMQQFSLKNLHLRNRIVMAPMLSRLCNPDGIVSQQLIDFYVERAKGGVGLIIMEYSYIDKKESKASQGQLGVYDDQLIAGLGDLAEAIKECGAKAILQICHAGRSTSKKTMGLQPIGPSPMPSYTGEMAREMNLEEIEATIQAFADAARRAKTAGFDGVELHGAHGYLLAQFLSPYTNRRADIYGRDRGLLALQTLDRVRCQVGSDYVVGYRISADEFIEGGITPREAGEFAKRLEEKGIDYIHVSGGIAETGQHIVIPVYLPKGHLLHLAEGIKKSLKIPVIAVGAIHDPFLAEEALQKNKADLIAMARALLADPEIPNKIKVGQPEEIRPCLRCNEGCRSRMVEGKTQRCAINAEAGRERLMKIRMADKARHVCVVGGGPAGLEAARVLALRGHRVTLLERERELGGLLRYASIPYFKGELRKFLQYLVNQVKKSKIEILLGHRATLESVKELRPDAVVIATGSTPHRPQIPGIQKSFVSGALDLLSGNTKTGENVLIVGGAAMGSEIAAHLAKQNKKITIIEMLGELALDLEPRSRFALLSLLKQGGVDILTGWKLEAIGDGEISLIDRNWNKKVIKGDSLILALGLSANQELSQTFKDNFDKVYTIGDCVEPRKIYQAIHEGAFVGRAI
jgi:2,4-dienoyl-CoA reductase-like NADH-dependent reductase (Old Yellow Enzyme family)/thioredoxin reductase